MNLLPLLADDRLHIIFFFLFSSVALEIFPFFRFSACVQWTWKSMKICLSLQCNVSIHSRLFCDLHQIVLRCAVPCSAQSTCNNLTQFFVFMFSQSIVFYTVQIKYPDIKSIFLCIILLFLAFRAKIKFQFLYRTQSFYQLNRRNTLNKLKVEVQKKKSHRNFIATIFNREPEIYSIFFSLDAI